MILKYHLKQQSKIMLGIAVSFVIIVLFFNITGSGREWFTLNFIIPLLPVFFTANIFSSEIENRTDFLIFTCRTPKYSILIQKYFSTWLISEVVICIIYFSAVFVGFEKSLFGLLALIVYSTLLSLIGLLISNISNNTLLGYGISTGILTVQMLLGARWHESHFLLSININIFEKSVQIWSNILFMIILIIILIIANLFIVSRGEHLRRKLIYKGTTVVIAVSLLFLFLYNFFFIKLEFWNNNNWRVISEENINLHYKNLDDRHAKELLKIFHAERKLVNDMFNENMCYNDFYVWYRKQETLRNINSKSYMMPFEVLKSFNKIELFGRAWSEDISRTLMAPILENVEVNNENEILKDGFQIYIYDSYIGPKLQNIKGEKDIIEISIYYSKNEYLQYLNKRFKELKELKESRKERESIHSLTSISEVFLYKLDESNHESTMKLLKYIKNSKEKLSYNDIECFIRNNYKEDKVKEVLNLYREIRNYHEKNYSNRGVLKEE